MSAKSSEQTISVPHPRETTALFGHQDAEATLLNAYRGGRIPHAWLIGGPQGIGKATLAYRMARFVLAHRDPASPQVQSATSLGLDPMHPIVRQVAAEIPWRAADAGTFAQRQGRDAHGHHRR